MNRINRKTGPNWLSRALVGLWLVGWAGGVWGQSSETSIKVYTFDDGLSHRNVFEIAQDSQGLIWLATINGLNRFDGYEFVGYSARQGRPLPVEVVSNVLVTPSGDFWLGSPGQLVHFSARKGQAEAHSMQAAAGLALTPQQLCLGPDGRLWLTTFDERTGANGLYYLQQGRFRLVRQLPGSYTRRPLVEFDGHLYLGGLEQELWRLNAAGEEAERYVFPTPETHAGQPARIADLQVAANRLWVLFTDGRLYSRAPRDTHFTPHALNKVFADQRPVQSLQVTHNGDVWLGGFGVLWYYDARRAELTDYDAPIRQLVKNTCTYRQIMQDRSGAVWVASDFGAIKITQSDKLFTQYLSGGSDYCSNVYCSTRGITEDEAGNIYISYYNSIHVVNPRTNVVQPLFPRKDYFNYPFGILYHQGALWTGNGVRIDLATHRRDTLFNHPNRDLGAVALAADGQLWFGYQHWLYRYDPERGQLQEFADAAGRWDSLAGAISYIYQGKTDQSLWVATLDQGLYRLQPGLGRVAHYHAGADSPVRLAHNQVNAMYEDNRGRLWLATARGLNRIDLADLSIARYTTRDGLPNAFLNGLLPEGDSCLWISTDNGLCRFSLNRRECTNFFTTDGLSSNEFNRISFYRSRQGRLYFGGLNGVNAFFPEPRYLAQKEAHQASPLCFTQFAYLDGKTDSLQVVDGPSLDPTQTLALSHRDRLFSFQFVLADYRQPGQNLYSYYLEGFDAEWSAPSTSHVARYTDIPPGNYVLRVRARAGREDWNRVELALPLHISQAYYRTWWFWAAMALLVLGGSVGALRYWVFLTEKRRRDLEKLVRERTSELADEKHKSEELLLNILPVETANELKRYGRARAKRHEQATVMFSDFRGFSRIAEQLEPEELVAEIDFCFRAFDEITERHGLEKIKTVGDAYLLAGGLGRGDTRDEAIRVVQAAIEIQAFMTAMAHEKKARHAIYFEARIGIHTGPLVAGVVGFKKFAYDIWGDTVNIASRMETHGAVGKVNISETTFGWVGEAFSCQPHQRFLAHHTDLQMYWAEPAQNGH